MKIPLAIPGSSVASLTEPDRDPNTEQTFVTPGLGTSCVHVWPGSIVEGELDFDELRLIRGETPLPLHEL